MRTRLVVVVVAAMVASSCGDDGVVSTDGSPTTETGTSGIGDTTFSSLDDSTSIGTVDTTSATTTTTTTGPTTTADTSTTDVMPTTGESSTTGEPVDPFAPPIEMPIDLGFDPLALALADVDGDGVLDLLVTGTAAGVVAGATLLGDGNGGFAAAVDAAVTACSAFPITGAIDDDSRADLFFGTCDTDATFYLGEADGTFTSTDVLDPWAFAPVRSSRFVDHDDDGDDDLVLLTVDNGGIARLHLALGQPAGMWPLSTTELLGVPGFEPNGVGIARLDADNRGDVLLVDVGQNVAYMLAEDPDGHADPIVLAVDDAPSSVAPFDFDDDGLDDLIIASRADSSLQLARNTGDGFDLDPAITMPGVQPFEVAVGRFDDDADLDLAILDTDEPTVLTMRGDGGGGYAQVSSDELPSLAVRLLAGDLDGNGRTDLVAATFEAGSITVLLAQ